MWSDPFPNPAHDGSLVQRAAFFCSLKYLAHNNRILLILTFFFTINIIFTGRIQSWWWNRKTWMWTLPSYWVHKEMAYAEEYMSSVQKCSSLNVVSMLSFSFLYCFKILDLLLFNQNKFLPQNIAKEH